MRATPGIRYIFQSLPHLLVPPFLAFTALSFLSPTFPFYLRVLLYVLSLPISGYARSIWQSQTSRREARAMGAQEVPLWSGKWPGNIDIVMHLYKNWKIGYPGDTVEAGVEKFGETFRIRLLGSDQIWTSAPDHIKAILATDFESFEKGDQWRSMSESVLGNGIFNADGDIWKFHRGMTRPYFSKDRISDLEIFLQHADSAINHAKSRLRDGFPIEFQDLVSRFTLDTATSFLFGSCVDSLSASLPYPANSGKTSVTESIHPAEKFGQAFSHAQNCVSDRGWSGPTWPLEEIWSDKTQKDMEVINGFIDPLLNSTLERKAKLQGPVETKGEDDTLLNHLVNETSDHKLIRDATLNILLAGRDTTSSLLTFVLYLLTQHPDVMARLREEIAQKVGFARPPTYEDIKEMSFTRAVLNETLRLFPPVPFNVRQTTRATTWPSNKPDEKPYYLPGNTSIVYCVWFMHRNTELWGPDALEFDPDRFLDERMQKYLIPKPFIFLPFNAGPRICLGQQFAYNQASFFLIRLLQTFESATLAIGAQPAWSRPPAAWRDPEHSHKRKFREEFWPKTHLTMFSAGGLWMNLNEAQNSADD